jgi:phosphoserine phosphatase
MRSSLKLIRDATPEILDQIGKWSVEKELWPARRKDVLKRLEGHKQAGAQVHIVSSAFENTVMKFAGMINVRSIGTPLEIVYGRVQFSTGINSSQGKVDRLKATLGIDHFDVAYGDTWSDIPMLEHSDHPVAVYPDNTLRHLANERGWEIIGD